MNNKNRLPKQKKATPIPQVMKRRNRLERKDLSRLVGKYIKCPCLGGVPVRIEWWEYANMMVLFIIASLFNKNKKRVSSIDPYRRCYRQVDPFFIELSTLQKYELFPT